MERWILLCRNRGLSNSINFTEEYNMNRYDSAKEMYAKIGVNTDLATKTH